MDEEQRCADANGEAAWQCMGARKIVAMTWVLIKPTALLVSRTQLQLLPLPRAQPTLSSLRLVGTARSLATRACLAKKGPLPTSSAVFGVTASSSPW